jgi:tetratricopeptide (TPR) repeat protein
LSPSGKGCYDDRVSRLRFVVGLAAGLACAAPAGADDAPAERARTHYEAGRALYRMGKCAEAVREFLAGYTLAPKPQFLINIGQGYRRCGQLAQAREMFEKFLATAEPNDPDRAFIGRLLAEVSEELARAPAAVSPSPSPRLVAAPAPRSPPRRSFAARNWWIFPLVAVVVAGAATGIYFGVRGTSCAADVCLDFGR